MELKTELSFTIFVFYLTGIYTQDLSCRLIDFNEINSLSEFEPCSTGNELIRKSYEDVTLEQFRPNVEYYLSNDIAGVSCIATTNIFNLDEATEFSAAIYLNSDIAGDTSSVEIHVFDTENGSVDVVKTFTISNEWNELHEIFGIAVESAKIEINAIMTSDAVLAIEYLDITNTEKDEEDCKRTITTEATTGITDDNLSCLQIDFNKTESILEFEPCSWTNRELSIRSYEDVSFESFSPDMTYHLTNAASGFSCLTTKRLFNLNEYTEFYMVVYLNSIVVDYTSFFEIQAYDTVQEMFYPVATVMVSSEWNELHTTFGIAVENAKIEISAFMGPNAVLAIEYLDITNSEKDEDECKRTTTELTTVTTVASTATTLSTTTSISSFPTPSTTDASPTTPTTVTQPTYSPNPIKSTDNSVWIILSFTFFLTTIIVIAVSIYIIYLYKSTVGMNNMLLREPITQSSGTTLPRLTVATSSRGDQIIVGIEKIQNSGVKQL